MHILLIEDDTHTAQAITELLTQRGCTVDHAGTGEAGLHLAGRPEVDVILLDRMLPTINGVQLVARLRAAEIEKPVLMLSALGRVDHRVEGLEAGVDDYLAKPFEPDELMARLRALYRRTTVQARQPVLLHGDIAIHVRARTAHRAGRHLSLSPKEFDLLLYMMENAGEVVTREMLLRHVWKLEFDPQTNVIDVHLVRLRRKLDEGRGTALPRDRVGTRLSVWSRPRTAADPVPLNFASLPIRQGLLFVTAGLAGMLCVALALIATAQSQLRADLLHTVDTDIAGLVDIQTSGGFAELQSRIRDRTALDPAAGEMPLYLLTSRDGHRLAGNVEQATELDPDRSEANDATLNGAAAVVRSTRLADGLVLTVGRSLAPVTRLRNTLWRVFGWTAAGLIVISAAIGLITARRLDARLSRLNRAFDRFDAGDLSTRVGSIRQRDEIDRLAAHVDAHLSTIARLLDVQRQISDNTAHELRTPLVHLDSRLLRVLDRTTEEAVADELIAARDDIRSIVSLFDGLLDIATVDGALGLKHAVQFDLSEVTASVAELYAASAEEAGIGLGARITPNITLLGEPMQLARMIANLLDNAFKYVPAGSHVRITLEAGPRLIVEDDGLGIAEADREHVFQRFTRGGASSRGHGLGLALVKVIALRHGLTARVEDAQPGARFVIEAGK